MDNNLIMSEEKFKSIEDLTDREVYDLMDEGDKFNEDLLYKHRGMVVNVALDSKSRIIAIASSYEKAYNKAIIRGCTCSAIYRGYELNLEFLREHNVLLNIALNRKNKNNN